MREHNQLVERDYRAHQENPLLISEGAELQVYTKIHDQEENQFVQCFEKQLQVSSAECSESESAQSDESTGEADKERFANVCANFFANDWVLCEVLKRINDPRTRRDIELTSKKFYMLSRRTPYHIGYTNLRVNVSFYDEELQQFCKVTVEGKSGSYFKMLHEFSRRRSVLGDLLRLIGQRYSRHVFRLTIHSVIDLDILKILNVYYSRIFELYCHGFSSKTLDFLYSPECTIARRIVKLGLYDFSVPAKWQNLCLVPFKKLRSISLKVWQGWPLKHLIQNLKEIHTLDFISIRNSCSYYKRTKNDECPNFTKLGSFCKQMRLCDQNILSLPVQDYILSTKNITHLELWLWSLVEIDIVRFFRSIQLDQLVSVSLNRLLFTDNIISAICSNHSKHPILRDLHIDGAYDYAMSNDQLFRICPPSLESLTIKQCSIQSTDLDMLPQLCPKLKYLCCDPGIIREDIPFEERRRFSAKGINFICTVVNLPHLERFVTRIRLPPFFLEPLCTEMTTVVKAQFPIHRIRKDKVFELLKLYFKVVKFTKYPYILDLEDSDVQTGIENRREVLPPYLEHFPFGSIEFCETWHVIVEQRLKNPPTVLPDFREAIVHGQLCCCDRINSLF
ncbi:unnamed protein product [Auanema sp. JU1783]|nr:unnamed protein product [Auanema sp. JU1783]